MAHRITFPRRRPLAVLAIVLALAATLAAALPRAADAAADGCVTSLKPSSCVKVIGSGLWVDAVAPGVHLLPRQSAHGYLHIWGSGFNDTTGTGTYWNQSYWHATTQWSSAIHIGRNLPDNSKICAQLIDASGAHAPACETVHR
jgi:hypothetical protein